MLCLPFQARAQQPTVAADAFVDSVGVNVHLHYFDTVYREFNLIRSRLIELGVRHVRDGLIDTTWDEYYTRFDSLAQAGIKTTFIVGPSQSTELWASYPSRMPRAFEAYEAPNELNRFGDANWLPTLRQTLVRMRTLRNDPRSAPYPVIGPSLTTADAYRALGDISAYVDAGNIHNYMGGRHPGTPGWSHGGYGSIAWAMGNVRPYLAGKPIITTENGYHGNNGIPDSVPEEVAGRYMPRLLMEQYRAGILRTFIYELLDWNGVDRYGLLHQDFSPKPAFRAVKGLLNLLSDPGPAFTPQNLGYSVNGGGADVRHMVFQKRDGTFFLALWLESSGYDHSIGQHVAVSPRPVTVATTVPMRVNRLHRWQHDGSVASSLFASTGNIAVELTDALTVIELSSISAPSTLPSAPLAFTATVSGTNVGLRWQAPAAGGAPTHYTIEAAASITLSNPVSFTLGAATELTVPNVPPGVYFARIRASNTSGAGPPSNVASFVVGLPLAPQLVASNAPTNPVTLAWSRSDSDNYVLSAGTSPGASDVAVVPMGSATQVTAQVPAGVQFYVRVAAVNAYGSTRSNEVTVAVSGPQQVGSPTLQAQVSGRRVTLAWTPGPGAPADNYVLVVGTAPNASNLGIVPIGRMTQIVGDSPVAGTFYVRILAQNAAGVASSNEVRLVIP